jgi:hypothetical protein
VHKLKTQISSLLQGKTAEGRFAAVVLVKGIVEAGGWEILHDSEKWVQGLLSILTVGLLSTGFSILLGKELVQNGYFISCLLPVAPALVPRERPRNYKACFPLAALFKGRPI